MPPLLQEVFYEAETAGQSLKEETSAAKGIAAIKDFIDKGIVSLEIISDFTKGIIYDERQIVDRIFSLKYPGGAKDALKIKEEIKIKIARPYFANLHTKLQDKTPSCSSGFVSDLKGRAINKENSKNGITFSNKSVKLSPRKNPIDSIVLHHMAVSKGYPVRERHSTKIRDGNNPVYYLGTGAHYIVLHDGKVCQLYDDKDYLNASDSFNSRSIAIEFAGNFPYGKFQWWGSSFFNYLTPAQALAGRCLTQYIKKNNPSVKYIVAHRQSCGPNRPYDPGRDVWLAVGEWAIRNLGLSDKDSIGNPIIGKCHAKCGGKVQMCPGSPIPDEWRKARI